jgi:glycosyltransferase involved in cell wall biosynthesis
VAQSSSKRVKILFLSQFFTPEPFFKALPFARGLARRGHSVEVLTGFPNYPGGRVYPGYRIRPWQTEYLDGIRVTRVALYPSHDQSAISRAFNYASFALSASALGPFLASRPDVVYVYHPPATVGLPACILKMFKGVPFVYDIQDLWPDTIATSGMMTNSLVLNGLKRWCSFVYRQADHLTVLSPGFRRALIGRGVPEDKISVIYNWCDEDNIRPQGRDEALAQRLGLSGRFNVIFAGTMGVAQGLDAVLEAAAICAPINPAVQFVFVGGGIEKARLEAKAQGSPNVLFLPRQPAGEISSLLALADLLLVHLKDDPLFRMTIPSKTQAFLAASKPILMAVSGDAADLVERAQAGITVQPENAAEIAQAILQMARLHPDRLREMGSRGRSFYLREMSMDAGIQRFEQLFLTVAGQAQKLAPPQSHIQSTP